MYGMPAGYDAWKTREPDYAEAVCTCDQCGDEILEGEDVYKIPIDGDIIHEDCFYDYARRVLEPMLEVAGADTAYA